MGMKRLMRELKELQTNPEEDFVAGPGNDGDIFIWHFILKGPEDSPFAGGLYHGKILFPPEYPMKPPDVIFLTPNGRFETNKKICLSNTSYHPETWQPSWSARVILTAIRAFFTAPPEGIGAINASNSERQVLALKSRNFHCDGCSLEFPDPSKTPKKEEKTEIEEEKPKIEKEEGKIEEKEEVVEEKPIVVEAIPEVEEENIQEQPIIEENQQFENENEENINISAPEEANVTPKKQTSKLQLDRILDISVIFVFILILCLLAYEALYC